MRTLITTALAPAFVGAMLIASASECVAQTQTPKEPQSPPQAPDAAADQNPKNDEPLSKKLDRNEGVLVPPRGVDPKIHKEPPTGTGDRMPVIVPPGEPGGNQQIQPK
jgi:hypothetical protein